MSFALFIPVKETDKELRVLLKKSPPMMTPRIKMLLSMKKAGSDGISKRELMEIVGACSQSIHNWRTAYKAGGIELLMANGRKGKAGKPSVFTKEEHKKMAEKLHDAKNGLAGYTELQQWIKEEFKKDVKYNTVLKYAIKHFGTSVKVARKSHVNKDDQAVEAFKETLLKR